MKAFQRVNLQLTMLAVSLTVGLILWQRNWGVLAERFPLVDDWGARLLFRIVLAITVVLFARIVIRNIVAHLDRRLEKQNASEEEIFTQHTLWRYGVGFVTVVIILSLFIEDWKVLVTSIGIIGAGIAVAMQHTIMNFVGWLFVIFQKPYRIGDRIEYANENLRGDVFDITIMFTKLRLLNDADGPTGKELYVPNEYVLTRPTINFTHPTRFIWDDIRVSVTYESDLKLAKEICERVLEECLEKEIKILDRLSEKKRKFAAEYSNLVRPRALLDFMASSIEVKLVYLVIAQLKNKKRTEIIDRLIEEFAKQDSVEFAYPHMHVKFDRGKGPNIQ